MEVIAKDKLRTFIGKEITITLVRNNVSSDINGKFLGFLGEEILMLNDLENGILNEFVYIKDLFHIQIYRDED